MSESPRQHLQVEVIDGVAVVRFLDSDIREVFGEHADVQEVGVQLYQLVDEKGYIRHDGGVVDEVPGMYVIGMPFLRRRKSTLIDGAADDANDLTDHLAAYLDATVSNSRA